MVESVNKFASLLQYSSWDDMIHHARYKMDYYMIHARLNYYSNSKNPRVIHTRFQNQKLTSLRTNPHDPYFIRPGEFLTLAKKHPDPEHEFDELLSCYNQRRIEKYRDNVSDLGSQFKRRRPVSEGTMSKPPELPKRENSGFASEAATKEIRYNYPVSIAPLAVRSQHSPRSRGTVRFSSPVRECSESHTHRPSGYCPIHLVPHPLMRDLALSRHLALGSEAGKNLIQSCESHSRLPLNPSTNEKNVSDVLENFQNHAKNESLTPKMERTRSDNEIDSVQDLKRSEKPRQVSQQSQNSHHSHISELSLMIANTVTAAAEHIGISKMKEERQVVKTKKIKRRLVKRPNSAGSKRMMRPRSDGSIATGEVTSHLLDLYSAHGNSKEEQHQREKIEKTSLRAYSLQSTHFFNHPKLEWSPSKVPILVTRAIANNSRTYPHSEGSLKCENTKIPKEGRYEFSQKTLRSRDFGEYSLRRPLSTRVFKPGSSRTHSKDSRCRCSTCDDTKVWQVVMSDISLSAARFSTGSDGVSISQRRPLMQIQQISSKENLKKDHQRLKGLTTMLFLNSMDGWYE